MKTLNEAIDRLRPDAAAILRKHLTAVGIETWEDITADALYDLRDEVTTTLAPGSARVVLGTMKTILRRVDGETELPKDYDKPLTVRGDTVRATYLTPEELARFEAVTTRGKAEKIVQIESLIEAYTGARLSDVMTFTDENFVDGCLVYTSIKTRVTATIPCGEKTRGWIRYAQEHRDDEPTLMSRNRIIRRLAQLAEIDEPVKTRRGGKERVTPKWEVLSSHSFRRSAASNLVAAGASINDARLCLGHTSCAMTERYVCLNKPALSDEAKSYLAN